MTEPRDLLLVDDHPIIQVAAQSLFELKLPGYRLHTASGRVEALMLAERVKPKMAVVDLMLPDGDGLELIRELRQIAPGCDVLVFSMQNEIRFGPRALRAGAKGYLMKGDQVSALIEAIHQMEAGRTYCSPALTEHLMRGLRGEHSAATGIDALSEREFQVFRLMGEGMATKQIASMLNISAKTVDSHRENLKAKLNCDSSTALVLLARDWIHEGMSPAEG